MILNRLTQKQLDRKVLIWQRRLLLQDWDIRAVLADRKTMGCTDDTTIFGWCESTERTHVARIEILRPEDYASEKNVMDYDAEATLVHEMLHVHFKPFEASEGTTAGEAQEVAVEQLARAFVQAYRRKN